VSKCYHGIEGAVYFPETESYGCRFCGNPKSKELYSPTPSPPPSPMNRAAAALEAQARRIAELEGMRPLLKEAVKIVHCHARNTDKDWLIRARAALSSGKGETT
jgi:hypothetical protein